MSNTSLSSVLCAERPSAAQRIAHRPFFFKDHCYLVVPFVLHAVTFRLNQLFVIESYRPFGSKCYRGGGITYFTNPVRIMNRSPGARATPSNPILIRDHGERWNGHEVSHNPQEGDARLALMYSPNFRPQCAGSFLLLCVVPPHRRATLKHSLLVVIYSLYPNLDPPRRTAVSKPWAGPTHPAALSR